MKQVILLISLCLLCITTVSSQQKDFSKLSGPYFGQTLPEKTPEIFAPGIVSDTDYRELGGCTFLPDGNEFYFTRSNGTRWIIMVSRYENGNWTLPEPFKISERYTALEPHISFDNQKIFWVWRGLEDKGMYMAVRTPEGWSEAEYVGSGMMVSSTKDGKIYITDYRFDPARVVNVEYIDGHFTNYEKLIGKIEQYQNKFRTAHPCVSPNGDYIIFDTNAKHMFVSFKDQNNEWEYPIDLTEYGLPSDAGIASISPDGKYLFFGYKDNIYWVSSKIIEEINQSEK